MAQFSHIPVLLHEAVDGLDVKENGVYVDGTAGGGGHSAEILKRLKGGRLFSIDQDPDAIKAVKKRFLGVENLTVIRGNFSRMKTLLENEGVFEVDGVLLDIGVSSHQLDEKSRGFSFHEDAPLDMRMSQSGESAKDLVNRLSEEELAQILFTYGEEKYARSIARGIVEERENGEIETTLRLAEIVKSHVPQKVRRDSHPARKTFQAIRIAVNRELEALEEGLKASKELLKKDGRLAVITFHSLEDRVVKQTMKSWARGCTCPKDFPVCVCGKTPDVKILTNKPIVPTDAQLNENPRARSAKLRICQKL